MDWKDKHYLLLLLKQMQKLSYDWDSIQRDQANVYLNSISNTIPRFQILTSANKNDFGILSKEPFQDVPSILIQMHLSQLESMMTALNENLISFRKISEELLKLKEEGLKYFQIIKSKCNVNLIIEEKRKYSEKGQTYASIFELIEWISVIPPMYELEHQFKSYSISQIRYHDISDATLQEITINWMKEYSINKTLLKDIFKIINELLET